MEKEKIDSQKLVELRDRMENSGIISIVRRDSSLVFTIDGFLDNEYGYIHTNRKLKQGETFPPFGFMVVRLIDLGEGCISFILPNR